MIHVLMVDDHKAVLNGVKMLLETQQMQVTTCYSGKEALEVLNKQSFDVMLYDLKMPGMDGLELTKKTLKLLPDAIIIIYSGDDISTNFDILMESGVSGIIDKSSSDCQLIAGIRMALEKMIVLPLDLVRQLQLVRPHFGPNEKGLEEPLTELELSIIKQVASGKTNQEIADYLKMEKRTYEYHLTRMYKKLKVRSRGHAIRKAVKLNIISS